MQKYEIDTTLQISQEMRKELNEKVLYLITNQLTDSYSITPSDIFNCYTGEGGLHGLEQKDFKNFHDYSTAKKEIEQGQFFTPAAVCKFLTDCIRPSKKDIIYDLTYGMGNFFNYLPEERNIYGTELDIKAAKVAQYLYPKANLLHGDLRGYSPVLSGDIIFGNPPFNLQWGTDKKPELSQMYYCKKAYQILKHAGFLVLIVPDSFLADDFSNGGDIERINQMFNFLVQFPLPDNLFKRYGVASFSTKAMILQKKSAYIKETAYCTEKLKAGISSEEIYQTYVLPAKQEAAKYAPQIYFECQTISRLEHEDKIFREKAVKLLFDIRRNKHIRHKFQDCEMLLQKYLKQKKPDKISWEKWQKSRLHKKDVLQYLKKTLSSANRIYRNERKIVKTNYGFKEKDYNEYGTDTPLGSINACVLDKRQMPGFERLLEKKQREFGNQSLNLAEMEESLPIATYLENWSVRCQSTGEVKKLNPVQKQSVNKLLQKRYGALQFAMGTGKTLCSLAMAQYRLQYSHIRNVIVVSTALAVNNTWEDVLEDFQIDFIRIKKRSDICKIKNGQLVLLTLHALTELKKEMKKFVRRSAQKIMLVFDEGDSITNPSSKRTKAMLSVFRKSKYKLLATGTMTRNNISEAAPQLELLYNNSINFLSLNKTVYYLKDGAVEEAPNIYYGLPFPAYRKGYELFSHSHLPKKITVFGLERENQDIYNAEFLDSILNKTVITKTFEEVVGRKIYKITQIACPFNSMDKKVYQTAVEHFDSIRRQYFKEADNRRKDSMFRIIQQLVLLLKFCAAPSLSHDYPEGLIPMKVQCLLKMLEHWNGERVAVGVRRIAVAEAYYRYIKEAFPDRPLFLITGEKMSCKKRQKVVGLLEKTSNGILLSTQQSLSESMNIDFVDKIILPELHYNNAAMSQYYFRFIRYTSKNFKRVVFLTYKNSIEANLLKMVLAKEKLNLFMKNEILDDDELYNRFGIGPEVFHTLMTLGEDQNGTLRIQWGKQEIS